VTTHNGAIKIWNFDPVKLRFNFYDVQLGHMKRLINCVSVDPQDYFIYCGTRYGDVLVILASNGRYKTVGPVKHIF
jgi:cilia- and flagella-associated protein 52